jgi:hypothetical protein
MFTRFLAGDFLSLGQSIVVANLYKSRISSPSPYPKNSCCILLSIRILHFLIYQFYLPESAFLLLQ